MAAYYYLRYVKHEDLTPAQRRAMNKQLRDQKKAIQAALKLVNSHLTRLGRARGASRKKKI